MDNHWRVQQPAKLVDAEVVTEGGRMCNMTVRNRQGGDACKADLWGGDEQEECRDGGLASGRGMRNAECAGALDGCESLLSMWKRHKVDRVRFAESESQWTMDTLLRPIQSGHTAPRDRSASTSTST